MRVLFPLVCLALGSLSFSQDRIGGTLVLADGKERPFFEVLRIRHRPKLSEAGDLVADGIQAVVQGSIQEFPFSELKHIDIVVFEPVSDRWHGSALSHVIARIKMGREEITAEIGWLEAIVVRFLDPKTGALETVAVPFNKDGAINIRQISFRPSRIAKLLEN